MGLQRQGVRFAGVFLMICGLGSIVHGVAEEAAQPLTIGAGLVFSLSGLAAYWVWRRSAEIDE